jgi:hypothetical protein
MGKREIVAAPDRIVAIRNEIARTERLRSGRKSL